MPRNPTRPADTFDRVEVRSLADWRAWLSANHTRAASIWAVTWKKGRPRYLPQRELVKEALAWGWIDSLPRRLDDDRTMLLFSPRKPGSSWSRVNRDLIAALVAEGRMQPPGEAAVAAAKADGSWSRLDAVEALEEPADLVAALDADPAARAYWNRFPPSSRRGILEWIGTAKRPGTRARRIAETARKAARNIKANHPAGRDRGPPPDAKG